MKTLKLPIAVLVLTTLSLFATKRNRDNLDLLSVRFSYLTTNQRIVINLVPLIMLVFMILLYRNFKIVQKIFFLRIDFNFFWAIGLILVFSSNFAWSQDVFNKIAKIYSLIGIGHLSPGFADWLGVLKGINSVTEPGEFFTIDCPGSCMQYRWQYPSLLLHLNFIHNLSSYVQITSFIIFVIFIFTFFKIYNKLESGSLLGFLFVLSPAFLLLFERMNPEIIVLLLIPILARCLFSEKYLFVSIIIIFLMAEVKFFPLILFSFLFVSFFRNWKYFLVIILGFCITTFLILQDLHLVGSGNLIAGYAATFGLIGLTSFAQGLSEPMLVFTNIPILLFLCPEDKSSNTLTLNPCSISFATTTLPM